MFRISAGKNDSEDGQNYFTQIFIQTDFFDVRPRDLSMDWNVFITLGEGILKTSFIESLMTTIPDRSHCDPMNDAILPSSGSNIVTLYQRQEV